MGYQVPFISHILPGVREKPAVSVRSLKISKETWNVKIFNALH
jgi:hypothetical protein